jgi:hypothetical protein
MPGSRSRDEAVLVNRIVAAMQRVERLLTPTAGDWSQAGRLIARRIRLQGGLPARDHMADVLILVSTARLGGVVVTANLRHVEAWSRLAARAGLDVAVRSSDAPD